MDLKADMKAIEKMQGLIPDSDSSNSQVISRPESRNRHSKPKNNRLQTVNSESVSNFSDKGSDSQESDAVSSQISSFESDNESEMPAKLK